VGARPRHADRGAGPDDGRRGRRPDDRPLLGVSHVNAFEWDGGTDVVFDLETIPDATAIDSLYLDNIRAGEMGTMAGRIDRFAVDLGSATGAARYGVGTSRGSERPRESEPGPRSSGSRRERSIAVYRRTVAS
jgi:hypothetical protein